MKDQAMWDRIAAHDFEGGDGGGLAAKVMQDTGWDGPRAEAAIEEYRRFIYLLAIVKTARRVAPKAVDTVWQAHMRDAAAYGAFCTGVLQRQLRYRAGGSPRDRELTQNAYRREFGVIPPKRIWTDPNRIAYWVIAGGLAAGGVLGAGFGGSIWPGVIGVAMALFILLMPKRAGRGGDDAAFWGMMAAGDFDGGDGEGSGD